MKWLYLLSLLLLLTIPGQNLHAQACMPDSALVDAPTGLYPEPFHPTLNPNGGITEIAYNNKPYEFVFTLVLEDTVTGNGSTIIIDYLELEEVSGLPNGLTAATNPGSGRVQENSMGCLVIRGTPDDTAGVYDISIRGRFQFGSSNVEVVFPDDGDFPNQRYLLTLEDGCPLDPCDSFDVSPLTQQATSCMDSCDGFLEVAVTGTAPFNYNWSGGASGATDNTASDLCAGLHRVTVTDDNGCTESLLLQVPAGSSSFSLDLSSTDVDCSGTSGTATATPTGGAMPYTYTWSNSATGASITGLAAGEYTVTVEDASGCQMIETVSVNSSAGIMASLNSSSDVSCNGMSDGSASINASGGSGFTYAWSGSASGNTGASASGLSAGSYTVTVTDGSGCLTTVSFAIAEPTALTVNTTKVDAACSTGSASATASGGTMPYTYAWSNGQSGADITNLSGGTYTLTVTDGNGCTITESVTIIQPADALSATAVTTNDVSCNGGSDGAAMVTAMGGSSGYSYQWSNGGGTNATLTGASAGIYTVTVTDSSACTTTVSATINEPTAISLNATATDVSCSGDTNGSVNVTATGGSGGFSYNWSGGLGTTASVSGVSAGTYTVTVTDADGCTRTAMASVGEPSSLLVVLTPTDVSCDGSTLGTANANATGGTMPYSYSWSTGQSGATVNDLSGGTYQVTVTDNSGCSVTESVTINAVSVPLQANISASNHVSCNGAADGSVTVTATGGVGSYNYTWSNGLTASNTATGLSGGTHRVTITDNGGCSVTETIVLNEPAAIVIAPNITDVSCSGQTDGMIALSVSGGSGGYAYNWDNGLPNNASQGGLSDGTYRVTVTDSDGCTNTASIVIDEPLLVGISATTTDVECAGQSTGAAMISVSGGTGPFTYDWSNDGNSSSQSNSLPAGDYTVTVTDGNGCVGQTSFSISQPDFLLANATAMDEATVGDGNASANPSGGTPPYTYEWSHNNSTNQNLFSLPPGIYTVTVTDANGCTAEESVTVSASGCAGLVNLEVSVVGISCNGAADGTATANPTGGAMPYSYEWSNGSTSQVANSLGTGTHTVTVTDANGCPATENISLMNPAGLVVSVVEQEDVSCAGETDGSIRLQPFGGTGTYSYAWAGGETTDRLTDLSGSLYRYTVTDINGCTVEGDVPILEPSPIALNLTNIMDESCAGAMDGSVTAVVAGGTPPHTYTWSNSGTTALQTNLEAGAYTLIVTDQNGCSAETGVNIEAGNNLDFDIVEQTNVSCNGGNDGTASILAMGGNGAFTYEWSHGFIGSEATDLEAGIYTITATDDDGCGATLSLEIEQPTPLSLEVTTTDQTMAGVADGTIILNPDGGVLPYTYEWDTPNNDTGVAVSDLTPGTYSVTMTDANNCTLSLSVTIGSVDCALSATISSTDVSCNGGSDGSATAEVTGNTEALTYLWSNGLQTPTLNSLPAGTIELTVTEGTGCSTMATVIINEPSELRATVVDMGNIACGGSNNGFAEIEAGGGAGGYEYLWSTGATTPRIEGLSMGDYSLTLSDANGCTDEATVTIDETAGLNVSIDAQQDVNCAGDANGAVTLLPSGGVAPYTYIWSNGETSSTLSNLTAATYTVTVNDVNNCNATISVEITEPAALTATATTTTAELCVDASNGVAMAEASGGTMPYTYLWSTGASTEEISDLTANTYLLTITDANGCTAETSVSITTGAGLNLTISSNNVTNDSSGSVAVGIEGGSSPYTYLWTDETGAIVGDTPMLENLAAGIYTLVITDSNGCTGTESVTIEEDIEDLCSSITMELEVNQPDCGGTSLGSINAIVSNAVEPITYNWSTEATGTSINNLEEGTYSLTVTDGNACSFEATATIAISNGFELSIAEMIPMSCQSVANGSATIAVEGGVAPYTFIWPVPGDSTAQRTNLVNGLYNVTVTDAAGCMDVIAVSVDRVSDTQAPNVVLQTAVVYLDETGNATISPAAIDAGTTDNCSVEIMSLDRTTFDCTDVGTSVPLILTAEDGVGNVGTQNTTIMVLDSLPPVLICPNDMPIMQCVAGESVTYPTPNAFDNCSGQIEPTLVEGLPSGANFDLGENPITFSAMDLSGNISTCTFFVVVEVFEVTDIQITEPACFNFATGSASVSLQGATEPLNFNWSNGQTTSTLTDVAAGDYSLTITDANNCMFETDISITQPPLLMVTINAVSAEIDQQGVGSINISVSGGREPYSYRWLRDGVAISSEEDLSDLDSGSYRVQVTDINGCSAISEEVTIALTNTEDILAENKLSLLPNPTSGILHLHIDLPQTYPYTAHLYDLNGRLLTELVRSTGQQNQHQFDLSNYQSGIYFVRIQVAEEVLTKRVVLMK